MNLHLLYPEIFLLISICVILLVDAFVKGERGANFVHHLSLVTLTLLGVLLITQMNAGFKGYAFGKSMVVDQFSFLLRICAVIAVGVTFIYARAYAKDRQMFQGELYTLGLFALLGIMVMIGASSLLMMYLGLELMSLSLYALVALRRDHAISTEAAMKYFVLGALASGFLLYGMSMVYGATGSLDISEIAKSLAGSHSNKTIMVFGCAFLVAGLAFKFGAVPFHMWVPDVYHGSPTAVTLMIASAPKLATFAIAIRLLAEGLQGIAAHWQPMLMFLAILSLAVGNLAAIAQTNFKRMLAYSTISHMGFLLLGLLSGVIPGSSIPASNAYGAATFYVVSYVLTTLATFGMIMLMARQGFEADEIEDFKGLAKRHSGFAWIMLILMFSLAGIPPFVGFAAKFSVLQSVVGAGHVWLAVYAVLMSLIGAFYYLRIVKAMFFEEPVGAWEVVTEPMPKVVLVLNGALVVVLGIFLEPLVNLCTSAAATALVR